jgi:hypothetical protein
MGGGGKMKLKRYQFIENMVALDGEYPVIADYGEDGPKPGSHAVWAWCIRNGRIIGFDPTDLLQWRPDSEVITEFDNLDEAIEYLMAYLFEPMLRRDRIRAVQEWLGQEASWEDAKRVLDALEEMGYKVMRDSSYPYPPKIVPNLDDRSFWKLVDSVLGRPKRKSGR